MEETKEQVVEEQVRAYQETDDAAREEAWKEVIDTLTQNQLEMPEIIKDLLYKVFTLGWVEGSKHSLKSVLDRVKKETNA